MAVLLFGFTAILGDLIQMSALMIVWWRVLLTSLSLVFLIGLVRMFREIPFVTILQFMGIGVIVALHWLTFYGAIKLSNASICLVALATTSFFTSLLEPLIMQQRVKYYEIGLGIFIVPGIFLVVNGAEIAVVTGLSLGLLSAFLASLFSTLNKKLIGKSDSLRITFLELGSACLFLSMVIPFYYRYSGEQLDIIPTAVDFGYLLVLSLLCTTLAYVLALRSLRHLPAFASNLTINLEPVYGIVLAWLILGDDQELNPKFYLGVFVIMSAVFSYPLLRRYFERGN